MTAKNPTPGKYGERLMKVETLPDNYAAEEPWLLPRLYFLLFFLFLQYCRPSSGPGRRSEIHHEINQEKYLSHKNNKTLWEQIIKDLSVV